MAGTPEWESELWSYLSAGDGKHCPFHSHCITKLSGAWCPDDNRARSDLLIENKHFNLSDYDFIESELHAGRCPVHEMVKIQADMLLKKGRVHDPPVPIELISMIDEQHPVEIRALPLQAYHGAIWRQKDGWIIHIRDKDSPAIQRLTVFHEAFHILAHLESTTPVFSKIGIKGAFNELLANMFASCVLMPEELCKEKWAEVHDLDRMAKIFGVPKPIMSIRLRRLGLI